LQTSTGQVSPVGGGGGGKGVRRSLSIKLSSGLDGRGLVRGPEGSEGRVVATKGEGPVKKGKGEVREDGDGDEVAGQEAGR